MIQGRLPAGVGAVCWLLAGWERSAEFELALDDWAEFGLSRFSASRGIMLFIPVLAVLMAVLPLLTLLVFVSRVSVGLNGSKVWIDIAVLPGTALDMDQTGPSMQIKLIRNTYTLVPPWIIIASATVVIALLALAVYRRSARRRGLRKLRRTPIHAGRPPNPQSARPEPDQSGELTRV